jgi:hypothetical protein
MHHPVTHEYARKHTLKEIKGNRKSLISLRLFLRMKERENPSFFTPMFSKPLNDIFFKNKLLQ